MVWLSLEMALPRNFLENHGGTTANCTKGVTSKKLTIRTTLEVKNLIKTNIFRFMTILLRQVPFSVVPLRGSLLPLLHRWLPRIHFGTARLKIRLHD